MRLLFTLLWAALAVLVVVAALRLRVRMRERWGDGPRLDEEAIRRIEREGRLVTDEEEPLDLDEIEEEERRFWDEEEWDAADEW